MITNEWIPGNEDISVPLGVRHEVFVEEQKIPADQDHDEHDALALHLVIWDDTEPVAVGRIWHDGKTFRLGRCAVKAEFRAGGIGDLLVKLLLVKAFEYSPERVKIHAQLEAVAFYERYGFVADGKPFDEAGTTHVAMVVTRKTLVLPSPCGDKYYEDFFGGRQEKMETV